MPRLSKAKNDYAVDMTFVGDTYHGLAKPPDGETYTAKGTDLFRTVCELADQVGIDLEDG
jgi:hypothetical protein